jgi:pimeloyl-[acyl-carrier protein] methyl ester esterase
MADLHIDSYGTGAPLLLIHGWGMHGGMWGGVVARLAEHYQVLTVDLPGHGYSADATRGKDASFSIDSVVDQLAAQFGENLTVCGWSLGGQIALSWALRHPQQVKRLVVVSSTPSFLRRDDWECGLSAEILQEFSTALLRHYALTLKRFVALQVRGSEQESEVLTVLRDALFSRGEPSLSALQSGLEILRDSDLRGVLRSVRQPTLVVGGERDTLTPQQALRYLAHQVPGAQLVLIKGAAHAPFLSHPDEFFAQLMNFLQEPEQQFESARCTTSAPVMRIEPGFEHERI